MTDEGGLVQWLRGRREELDMTQLDVAAASGQSDRNIKRWEAGQLPDGVWAFLRYLDAVGVRLVPEPAHTPRALNEELRLLREEIAGLRQLLLEATPVSRRASDAYHREMQRLREELRAELVEDQPDESVSRRQATG